MVRTYGGKSRGILDEQLALIRSTMARNELTEIEQILIRILRLLSVANSQRRQENRQILSDFVLFFCERSIRQKPTEFRKISSGQQ